MAKEDGRAQVRYKGGQKVVRSLLFVVCCKGCDAFLPAETEDTCPKIFFMDLRELVGYE